MTLEERIPLTKLGTILKAADSVAGLHLGACSIGKAAVMKKVLKRTSLKWIAAYDREVPVAREHSTRPALLVVDLLGCPAPEALATANPRIRGAWALSWTSTSPAKWGLEWCSEMKIQTHWLHRGILGKPHLHRRRKLTKPTPSVGSRPPHLQRGGRITCQVQPAGRQGQWRPAPSNDKYSRGQAWWGH